MLKRIIFLSFLLYFTQISFGQHTELSENKGELGVMMGLASYVGDIAPDVQVFYQNYGAFYKRSLNNYAGIRVNVEMQKLGSHDILSSNVYAWDRNADFLINTLEASIMGEFNFLNYISGSTNNRFSPYMGFGVGYFYTFQELRNNNTSASLAVVDLGNPPPSQIKLSFPMNLGLKYNIYKRFNLFGEATYRFTNFDNLDYLVGPISTFTGFQGSRTGNDQYFSLKLGLSYSFNTIFGIENPKPVQKSWLSNKFRRK